EAAAHVLTSLTKLSARMKPVTAETLKACCSEQEKQTVRAYWKWTMCLAAVIVPFSLASFVTSGFSDGIRKDIVSGNELAVKLTSQLHPIVAGAPIPPPTPPGTAGAVLHVPGESRLAPGVNVVDVLSELQQFASTIRS